MKLSNDKLAYQKRILELIDPVAWLRTHTDFRPWRYEAELLRSSHLRTRVVRKSRQVGITTTIAHEAIWKAYTTPNRVILIVSPSDRQSKIVMTRIQGLVDSNEELYRQVTRKNTSQVDLSNGSMILSLPNNPDRLRGFTATDIYLDEAAHFLNDGPVMAAIKPMLIASKGTFTVVSTPFGKEGPVLGTVQADGGGERNPAGCESLRPLPVHYFTAHQRRGHETRANQPHRT